MPRLIAPGPITPVTIIESLQARDGFPGFPTPSRCPGQSAHIDEFPHRSDAGLAGGLRDPQPKRL